MFGPSPQCVAATVASADFCWRLAPPLGVACHPARKQISRGKTRDFLPINPSHLRLLVPGGVGLQVPLPPRPPAAASHALRVPRAGDLPRASFPRRLATAQLPHRL